VEAILSSAKGVEIGGTFRKRNDDILRPKGMGASKRNLADACDRKFGGGYKVKN